jgi:hypothetical protein
MGFKEKDQTILGIMKFAEYLIIVTIPNSPTHSSGCFVLGQVFIPWASNLAGSIFSLFPSGACDSPSLPGNPPAFGSPHPTSGR